MEHFDRLNVVLGIFASSRKPPLTLATLAERAGVSTVTLSPGYSHERSPVTLRRIATAADQILTEVDILPHIGDLPPWIVECAELPIVEDAIGRAAAMPRCNDCGDYVIDFTRSWGLCGRCLQALTMSDSSRQWLAKVGAQIGTARQALQDAWARVQADDAAAAAAGRANPAISYKRLALAGGMDEDAFKQAWAEDGLPLRPVGRPRKLSPTGIGLIVGALLSGLTAGASGQQPTSPPLTQSQLGLPALAMPGA